MKLQMVFGAALHRCTQPGGRLSSKLGAVLLVACPSGMAVPSRF